MPEEKDASVILKARKKMIDEKVAEKFIMWAIAALMGVGSGVATTQVKGANETAVVQSNRNEVEKLKADLEMFRSGFLQRVDVEEKERTQELTRLRERILVLETILVQRGIIVPRPSRREPR